MPLNFCPVKFLKDNLGNERWEFAFYFFPVYGEVYFADSLLETQLTRPTSCLPFNFFSLWVPVDISLTSLKNFISSCATVFIKYLIGIVLTWGTSKAKVTWVNSYLPLRPSILSWGTKSCLQTTVCVCVYVAYMCVHAPFEERRTCLILGRTVTWKRHEVLWSSTSQSVVWNPRGFLWSLRSNDLHINTKTLFSTLNLSQMYSGVLMYYTAT